MAVEKWYNERNHGGGGGGDVGAHRGPGGEGMGLIVRFVKQFFLGFW